MPPPPGWGENNRGGWCPFFAPLLGALGAFFSGSNTVSNLTFAPIQAAIAGTLGLDGATVLALQSAGGAMGNMVCIHNIVAVGEVLGLSETRGADRGPGAVASVLRLTIGPLLVYAVIAAAVAGVFGPCTPERSDRLHGRRSPTSATALKRGSAPAHLRLPRARSRSRCRWWSGRWPRTPHA